MEVLSALIPSAVVGGAFVFGVVKLLRSEAAGLRSRREPDDDNAEAPSN